MGRKPSDYLKQKGVITPKNETLPRRTTEAVKNFFRNTGTSSTYPYQPPAPVQPPAPPTTYQGDWTQRYIEETINIWQFAVMVENGQITERDGWGYYSDGGTEKGDRVDTYHLRVPHPRGFQYVTWYWYKR
jgi:hypothetical protein